MKGFVNFLEESLVPIAAKIGGQKHLVAVRDAFAGLMPLIMAGAFAVLINNVFIVSWSLLANFIGGEHPWIVWASANLAPLFSAIDAGTLSIIALALVFSLGYTRATYEKMDALSTGLISVGSFILLGALSRSVPEGVDFTLQASWVGNYLAAQGIFVALLVGLVAPEIYFAIARKGWVIKMPDSVPPAVSRGFSAIIPGIITITAFAVLAHIFNTYIHMGFLFWFEMNISSLFLKMGQSIITIVIVSTLIPVFWFFGLHGANIMEAFMSPVYGTLGNMNIQLFQQGSKTLADGLHPWVRGSWDAYVFIGGSGATLALLVGILLFSKRQQDREIAKLGLPCGIFQINEPVLFGLPVVLNPIYIIPFILVQPVLTLIAYFATMAGIAGPVVNSVAWTTPPVLSAYLATNGSVGAALVALVNLAVAFVIYVPFVFVANTQKD